MTMDFFQVINISLVCVTEMKTLKPQFPLGNIDSRKIFEAFFLFCDDLF